MAALVRILIENVSYTYPDGTKALKNVNLSVRAKDFLGLLGANGSGKTTLLKVADGLCKDFQGEIYLDGKNIKSLASREIYQKVGLVFQNPDDQLFASTVFEDIAFGPRNMGFKKDEVQQRVIEVLTRVEMDGYANKSIHNLSYGQKKRICIAGLLAMGHEILLLDEPTAGLDPMGEYKMMNLLTRLNKDEGVTILMATHNVDLVPLFLDRLLVLSGGELIREGTPEEVFAEPEKLTGTKLRLPQVAELIRQLKDEDGLPFDRLSLTVGDARRKISEMFYGKARDCSS